MIYHMVVTNFILCSKKIIAKLLEPHKQYLEIRNIILKETTVLSLISKAKAKGQDADDLLPTTSTSSSHPSRPPKSGLTEFNDIQYVVSQIYREYERTLRRNNCLDFDDLLLFGVKLFSGHPSSVAWCRHVLVDEL
jgi:DNA helicase-2/ATP-dependent DNA helicase PcrA